MTTTGTTEATYNGKTCTRSANSTSETWIAPDVDLEPAIAKERRAMLPQLNAFLDSTRRIAASTSKLPHGTSLRVITTSSFTDSAGVTHPIVATVEFLELEHGPLADSLFTYPPGYRLLDMRGRELPTVVNRASIDSAVTAGIMRTMHCD